MISDEELLAFNKKGYIPGPIESEKDFLKRINMFEDLHQNPKDFFLKLKKKSPCNLDSRIKKPFWSWTRTNLNNLYGFAPENFSGFFCSKRLSLFEGAATWVIELKKKETISLLQLRKSLKYKNYLKIYRLDEILAHEAVHIARSAFKDKKFEEMFAYLTSSLSIRKCLGPIARSNVEVLLFFSIFLSAFIFSFAKLFFYETFFFISSYFCLISSLGLLSYALIRLFFTKIIFKKTFNKFKKILKDKKKPLKIMIRLTDDEIVKFSNMKIFEIIKYIDDQKEKNLRFRLIKLAYF